MIAGAVSADSLAALRTHVTGLGTVTAGVRNLLGEDPVSSRFANSQSMLGTARAVLGENARPVRIILFDKTPETNWGVPWHQDLNIAIRGDSRPADYGPWSSKKGVPHVIPPTHILESMVTLRLHLDPCSEEQGALRVIPGSHNLGKVADAQIAELHSHEEGETVVAQPGDLLLMRPLILHSSKKATSPANRRIIHIEYAATELADGLDWYFT